MGSRPGEAEGYELLQMSAALDNILVPRAPTAEAYQVMVTFAIRARRLTQAIFNLLDQGLEVEAEMLERVLMETAVTLQWIARDFDSRITRWRLEDANARLAWDDNYAKGHAGDRMLSAKGRREIEITRERLIERDPEAEPMPKFWERCAEVETSAELEPSWYILVYKRASHGAIHPSTMALERFIDHVDEAGAHLLASGPNTKADDAQHEWAALWLHIVLDVLARCAPLSFRWREFLDAIGARLAVSVEARQKP